MEEGRWYLMAQNRGQWRSKKQTRIRRVYTSMRTSTTRDITYGPSGAPIQSRTDFICGNCQRSFRRSQDMARHKCNTTRPRIWPGISATLQDHEEEECAHANSVCHSVAERQSLCRVAFFQGSRYVYYVCVCMCIVWCVCVCVCVCVCACMAACACGYIVKISIWGYYSDRVDLMSG